MEEQTEKSDVRNGLHNDVPLLQSMLAKLSLKHKHPKTDNVKLHSDKACKNLNGFVQSEESITNEEDRKDGTVIADGDEEQPARSSETEDGNEAVEEVPRWERRDFHPVSSLVETKMAELSRWQSESEDKQNKETWTEEHVAGAALLPNNPSQETSAHTSYLCVSSDKADSAQVEFEQELLDEACGGPSKPVSMDTSRVLTHQTVNLTSKTTRSASDPVSHPPPKEERPLSAPSILNLQEYEKYQAFANAMPAKSFSKAAKIWGQEDLGMSTGDVENDSSLTKTQKKGVKNKMKILTQKLIERLKEKRYFEHTGSKSTQDTVEEKGQNMNSMEMEAEDSEIPPPLPPKKGKYVVLDRRFTLRDFKLDLEPINLMEEIFTGSEWLSYLPSKETPTENDTSDQSMTNEVLHPEKHIQINDPLPKLEEEQSEDVKDNQDSVSNPQEDSNVAKTNSDLDVKQAEPDANVFAIPKALLTNNAIKQKAGTDCELNKSDDIYDRVDLYIIPKKDFPAKKRKASDAPLDFSAVKSFELLDNSALKSRIRLSKKRHHRPPKKHRKVKLEMSNTIFYKIPPVILNESPVSASQPRHSNPFSMSPPLLLPSRPYQS
ncbi:hypothetical protein H4Q32_005003 [Labeo rohita]|uniref:Uncharacterized protein n=1 Tax=Labeo rohita TaxID=84645 RepID=A0ABQ8N009_LABRO|nr:uncharacterized protein si:dkey-9i23.6 [Labeo rohita]KAI2668310.1 hypothetical protein H4Q32_005003 [Labeo rohita]